MGLSPIREPLVITFVGSFAAGIIIALLAPITGQRADRRGKGGLALMF